MRHVKIGKLLMQCESYGFETSPQGPPSLAKSLDEAVVQGDVVTRRAQPLTTAEVQAMSEGKERPTGMLMNPKLRQICVHLIGGDTSLAN